MSKQHFFKLFYWVLPVLFFIPQILMSYATANQFRFEELVESVMAPLWFDQRLILSGIHVNIGWYGILLFVYKIFGFTLYTGRMVNLFMAFVSFVFLSLLLKKFFDLKIAAIILITLMLSPTLLFINSLSLHWAISIHLIIIVVYLLSILDFSKKRIFYLEALTFLLLMVCWLFYQAVVFYLPAIFFFYFVRLRQRSEKFAGKVWQHIVVSTVAFLLPLVSVFIYVKNRNLLVFDPEWGSGIFRGGGTFKLSADIFSQGWIDFFSDFFVKGVSHHFEVASAEFSYLFPIITLIFVFYAIGKIWNHSKSSKLLIFLALLVIGFDLFVFSTTTDLGLPGMKRLIPSLLSTYFLWVMAWWGVEKREIRVIGGIWVIRGILGLFLVHHLIVYPANLAAIKDPSPFKVDDWFDTNDPQMSVSGYVELVQQRDLRLDCRQLVAKGMGCFYDFIYPAVAGSCEWNNLECRNILGYDVRTNQFIPLNIGLWQRKYWEE